MIGQLSFGALLFIILYNYLFGIGKLQIRCQLIVHQRIYPPFIWINNGGIRFRDSYDFILMPHRCGVIIIFIGKIILIIGLVQAGEQVHSHQECKYKIPVGPQHLRFGQPDDACKDKQDSCRGQKPPGELDRPQDRFDGRNQLFQRLASEIACHKEGQHTGAAEKIGEEAVSFTVLFL